MKIAAIIQARTGSSRLPNKIIKELPINSGFNSLLHVIRRLQKSEMIHEIIIATTPENSDNIILDIAEQENVKCFRGDSHNLLSRYYNAAKENEVDVVIRITSDCPCIDPAIVDSIIKMHIEQKSDYTSNTNSKNGRKVTFPHGMDVEVFNFMILEEMYLNASTDWEKEHVTPYIYLSHPDKYKICHYQANEEEYGPEIRVTLDTEDDYILLCAVFDHLYPNNHFFGVKEIVKLFRDHPWLNLINKKTRIKSTIKLSNKEDLQQSIKLLELQELKYSKKILEEKLKKLK